MATFPTFSQKGGPHNWIVWGGGITNHEVFTFTLQSPPTPLGVGATVSEVAVIQGLNETVHQGGSTIYLGEELCYLITLNVVNGNLSPITGTVTGNFESTGI
jgi:hypothetical protein